MRMNKIKIGCYTKLCLNMHALPCMTKKGFKEDTVNIKQNLEYMKS